MKEVVERNNKPFNSHIRYLISHRRNIIKNQIFISEFREKYLYITERIGYEMSRSESRRMNKLIDNNNYNQLYKYMKKQLNKSTVKTFIDDNGDRITDPPTIVLRFKNLFESKLKKYESNDYFLCKVSSHKHLSNIEISMNDLLEVMNHFNFNTAQGITFIDNKVFKNCLNGTCELLFCLITPIIE